MSNVKVEELWRILLDKVSGQDALSTISIKA